jgi:hypothetical protein
VGEACRDACARIGEPLAGSAGRARAFVAIAWPKRRWHPDKAARSEGLPAELAELETRSAAAGRKLSVRVFQREPGTPTARVEVLAAGPELAGVRLRGVPIGSLVGVLEALLAGAEPGHALEPIGPELLVCTDGLHDDCCARFGRPVYRALCDEVARTGAAVGVSECSHLGGHRFAANALVLPDGDLYGRLEVRDAAPLVGALSRGELLRYRYRGRLGASEGQQVADAFLAARLPEGAHWELVSDGDAVGDELTVTARVSDADGSRSVLVRCERQAFDGPGSCGEALESRTRWVPVALDENPA